VFGAVFAAQIVWTLYLVDNVHEENQFVQVLNSYLYLR
jgi:hypothetical protein